MIIGKFCRFINPGSKGSFQKGKKFSFQLNKCLCKEAIPFLDLQYLLDITCSFRINDRESCLTDVLIYPIFFNRRTHERFFASNWMPLTSDSKPVYLVRYFIDSRKNVHLEFREFYDGYEKDNSTHRVICLEN